MLLVRYAKHTEVPLLFRVTSPDDPYVFTIIFLLFIFHLLQGSFLWLTEMFAATPAWYVLFLLIITVVVLKLCFSKCSLRKKKKRLKACCSQYLTWEQQGKLSYECFLSCLT